MLRRAERDGDLRGGAAVFPGGVLDARDREAGAWCLGPDDATASARFFGTKKGRKFPAFGVSLGGVGGYRLQVSAGKKTLEIFQGDELRQSVAYEWKDESWTSLRVQVRKAGAAWIIEGKAWPAGTPEPAAWTITFETKEEPPAGRAGIWGSPFSGTPIRFDDLDLSPAH